MRILLIFSPFIQTGDGGLLEEVQRPAEAEGRHPHHHARLEELFK